MILAYKLVGSFGRRRRIWCGPRVCAVVIKRSGVLARDVGTRLDRLVWSFVDSETTRCTFGHIKKRENDRITEVGNAQSCEGKIGMEIMHLDSRSSSFRVSCLSSTSRPKPGKSDNPHRNVNAAPSCIILKSPYIASSPFRRHSRAIRSFHYHPPQIQAQALLTPSPSQRTQRKTS